MKIVATVIHPKPSSITVMLGLLLRTVISIFSFISCVNRGKFYHRHKIRHTTLNTTLKQCKYLIYKVLSVFIQHLFRILYVFLTLLDISHFSRNKPFVCLNLAFIIPCQQISVIVCTNQKGCIRVVWLYERFTD